MLNDCDFIYGEGICVTYSGDTILRNISSIGSYDGICVENSHDNIEMINISVFNLEDGV